MTNNNNLQQHEQPAAEPKTRSNADSTTKKVRIHLIPIWLRVILVLLLFFVVIALGLIVGYSVLGDGNATDALKWPTWQHMIDIMKGVE